MTATTRVLVAGVGNIFLGDDAFGVEVVSLLRERAWPEGVRVVDFGTRGLDLAFALESCDAAILVDAVARGGAPGTLYVIEPRADASARGDGSAHGMTIERVLARLPDRPKPRRIRIVGCEPSRFGDDVDVVDEEAMILSAAVAGVLDEAARIVASLVEELLVEPRADA